MAGRRAAALGGALRALPGALRRAVRTPGGRRARHDAQDPYRLAFEHALVGLAVLQRDAGTWRVEHANLALTTLLGRDVTRAPFEVLVPGVGATLAALTDGALPAWQGEEPVEAAGRLRLLHVGLAPLPDGRLAAQVVDVTDRAAEHARLRDLALHDPLTGLPNRSLLADRLELAVAGTARSDRRVVVAYCDLDDFKAVNDSLGHAAGDAVLVTVASRLRDAVRPADTVARIGGDEFVVLCPDVPDEHAAGEIAARLLAALRAPVELDGVECHRGGSVGVAVSAPGRAAGAAGAGALLHAADVAMYRAKRSGKSAAQVVSVEELPGDPGDPDGTDGSRAGDVVDVRPTDRMSA